MGFEVIIRQSILNAYYYMVTIMSFDVFTGVGFTVFLVLFGLLYLYLQFKDCIEIRRKRKVIVT